MIEYRRARSSDLGSVVRIHREAFAGFFLTRLGPGFLTKYYRLVLERLDGILIVAANDSDVAGFVAGFASPAGFYGEMKKRKLSFALASIPALLCSPGIIRRLLLDFREVKNSAGPEQESGRGELSSIGVAPCWSGHGVGRGLLAAFIARSKELGLKAITLTTDADGNDAVNEFYRKAGFRLERTFRQGDGRRMNEYLRNIP
ncbi:MAG: GNAT family N-acetyltransferase [Candidatus Aminicenantes bacterium]|nr:GNAT family N-acetyltransferase [Candidatus Aminicenantes bacterium]